MNAAKITVPLKAIKAMLIFASKDETRMVLNSLHFEVHKAYTLIVSTDGRRMAILRVSVDSETECAFTVPSEMLEPLVPLGNESTFCEHCDNEREWFHQGRTVSLSFRGGVITATVTHGESEVLTRGKEPSAPYSKWRQVLLEPEVTGVDEIALNGDYVKSFQDAAAILQDCHTGSITLRFRGAATAVEIGSGYGCDFYGVLMPVRITNEFKRPAWLDVKAEAK